MNARFALPAFALAAVAALTLSACVANTTEGSDGIAVSSTADKCAVATTTAPAGPVVFHVTNDGTDVTEFYLLAEDGLRLPERIVSDELGHQAASGRSWVSCTVVAAVSPHSQSTTRW